MIWSTASTHKMEPPAIPGRFTALRLGSLARWEVALWPPELAADIPELTVETLIVASAAVCPFATSASAYRSLPLIRVAGWANSPKQRVVMKRVVFGEPVIAGRRKF